MCDFHDERLEHQVLDKLDASFDEQYEQIVEKATEDPQMPQFVLRSDHSPNPQHQLITSIARLACSQVESHDEVMLNGVRVRSESRS